MKEIIFNLSPKQTKAWEVLESPEVRELLYGGAKGGGKSVFGCFWTYSMAKQIIELCQIEKQEYPTPVGFMGRKRGVNFADTTLESWKKFIPSNLYELRKQDKEIIIDNAVKICFGGFDDENEIKKFNSAEYAFYFIDQAEEVTRDDIALLRGTLRLKINDIAPPYKGLLTANPAPCWLKDDFILNPPADGRRVFIQALPKDNPFLSSDYIEGLKDALKHRPELQRAYIEGNWDELEGADLVIQYSIVKAAVNKQVIETKHKKIVACDPARYGNDETVIYALQDGRIIDQEIYGHKSAMETAGRLVIMRKKHNANRIVIDEIGIGAGIVDRLRELQEPVYGINSAGAPNDKDKYINIRAEMWWQAGEMFNDGKCSIPDDSVLIGQLASPKYEITSNGKIQIEGKADIKKRLGNSPDRADAYVMGLYGLRFASPIRKESGWDTVPYYPNRYAGMNVDPGMVA